MNMERCKECELAIYCFSDTSSWTFRTKREMEEKTAAILNCDIHAEIEQLRAGGKKATG
jgi:hypothetical protein